MAIGTVKWFDSKLGYGFIREAKHGEVFVHHSAITGEGFKTLRRNEEVEFEIVEDPRGLQAANVIRNTNSDDGDSLQAGEDGAPAGEDGAPAGEDGAPAGENGSEPEQA